LASTGELLATEDLRDRFRLERWRFGTPILDVYDGHDLRLDRPVHIRLLKPFVRRSPEAVRRFLDAARRAAGVVHPNLVAVYDGGSLGGRLCIVTEAPASRLADYPAAVDAGELRRLANDFVWGLRAAHDAGLVHGALDDTALMIDDDGVGKVADVGLYAAVAEVLPRTRLTIDGPLSPSTDGDLRALAAALTKRANGHDDALEPVRRALSVVPTERYESAGAMAAALDEDSPPSGPSIPPRPDARTQTLTAPTPRPRVRGRVPTRLAAWVIAAVMLATLIVVAWRDTDPPIPGRPTHTTQRSDLPPEIPRD
jgi:hypothetical protein